MKNGRFIVFEGLDGAGTSTQVYKLRDFLINKGIAAEVSKEPTNGPIGSVIRQAIEGRVTLDPKALALAFAADRVDHLFNNFNGVMNALSDGRWIISDRYVLSSLAYQGLEIRDLPWLEEINKFVITPDLTIFVDTPVAVCADRIGQRSNHFELFHSSEKLENVAMNFTRVHGLAQLTGKLIVVDGDQNPDEVFESFLPSVLGLVEAKSLSHGSSSNSTS
jgi:dTMP kinase